MTLLSSLVSLAILLSLLALAAGIAMAVYLARERSGEVRRDAADQRGPLLVLGALAVLPLALLLVAQAGVFPVLVYLVGIAAWALLAAGFWERWASPATAEMWETAAPGAPPSFPPARPAIPRPLVEPRQAVAPVDVPEVTGTNLVHKQFRWTYVPRPFPPYAENVAQTIEVDISRERYEERHAEPRRPSGQWSEYATADLPECKALAAHFWNLHLNHDWSTFEQAGNVLAFVQQCLVYASDEATTPESEWPRYPIESLMEERGDCEDSSILAAAVLARLGFQVALLHYPGHCAAGIAGAESLSGEFADDPARGRRYFFAETTATGWHIGEVPAELRGVRPDIEPVEIVMEGR